MYLTDCPKIRSPFYFHYLSSRNFARQMIILYYYSVCPINDRSILFIRRVMSDTWLICVTCCCENVNGLSFHLLFNLSSMSFWQTTIPSRLFVLKWLSYSAYLTKDWCITFVNKIWFTCCCCCCCLKMSIPFSFLFLFYAFDKWHVLTPLVLNRLFYFMSLTNGWPSYTREAIIVSPQICSF